MKSGYEEDKKKRFQILYKMNKMNTRIIVEASGFFINSYGDIEFSNPTIIIARGIWQSVEELPIPEPLEDTLAFEGYIR